MKATNSFSNFQLGEGDCDSDTSCLSNLRCGVDNCVGEGFDQTDDCCYDPEPFPVQTTTKKPKPEADIDCKAMEDLKEIIRNAKIVRGCDTETPIFNLATCTKISCFQQILKETDTCGEESERSNCNSLEKVSEAIRTVTEAYCESEDTTTTTDQVTNTNTNTQIQIQILRLRSEDTTMTTDQVTAMRALDFAAVRKDLEELMTTSQVKHLTNHKKTSLSPSPSPSPST